MREVGRDPHDNPSCVYYAEDDLEEVEGDYFGEAEAARVKKTVTEKK